MCADHTYDQHRTEYSDEFGGAYCFTCAVRHIMAGNEIYSSCTTLAANSWDNCKGCGVAT